MKLSNNTIRKRIAALSFFAVLLAVPWCIKNAFVMILVDQVLVYSIAVLGLNFITGLVGQTCMGMAGIFALGAYTSTLLVIDLHVPVPLGIAAAAGVGVILGLMLGYPSLRLKGIYFALTTVGFGEIVRLVLNNATNITKGANGIRSIPHFNFFGLAVDTAYSKYYVVLIFAAGAYILSIRIINSRWGRAFQAIRDNETSVESNGINIARVKITAFIICCVFGSLGGALYAHLMNYINPLDFNADLSVRFLMMLMLGGIGSAPGCILGVAVVVFLPELLKFTKGYYWFLFSFSMLLMVMFRPYGLVSIFRDGIKLINKTAGPIRKV